MSKFTPGPWEVETIQNDDGWLTYDIYSPEYGNIAYVSEDARPDLRMIRADTHLIKAAPEMYEALESVVKSKGVLMPNEVMDLEELLAKARGES